MDIPKISRYEDLQQIGSGGMGKVYRAYAPHLKTHVAIKTISQNFGPELDEVVRERLKREGQAGGRLRHPHIIPVYGADFDHEPPYIVMKYLEGGTLGDYLKKHKIIPWQEALELLYPMVLALYYAHEVGVIHRDIKPENVMFDKLDPKFLPPGASDQILMITDFGLAHQLDAEEGYTKPGDFLGTPAYMSPEQAKGQQVDARTDIFALGIILFEAITGINPLRRKNARSDAELDSSPLDDKAPTEVVQLIKRLIAKDREQRYPTCAVLERDWLACLGKQSTSFSTDTYYSTYETVPSHRPPSTDTSSGSPGTPPPPPKSSASFRDSDECGALEIDARGVDLPPDGRAILCEMFADYRKIVVEEEIKAGFTSRVYIVHPFKDVGPRSRVVAKMAPARLIEEEYEAYKQCIEGFFAPIAQIKGEPARPVGRLWWGLCYHLIGDGVFEIESVKTRYQKISTAELVNILKKQLLKVLGEKVVLSRGAPDFFVQDGYESLLPVNIVIIPSSSNPEDRERIVSADDPPTTSFTPEERVLIEGFEIVEVKEDELLLNIPLRDDYSPRNGPPRSYRILVQQVETTEEFEEGMILDRFDGVVKNTREELLKEWAKDAVGQNAIDPTKETVELTKNISFENPIHNLAELLIDHRTVRIGPVHGDVHSDNVIVELDTSKISLIDFAKARYDHILHDLLRLETNIMTWLLPLDLAQINSYSPQIIYDFYKYIDLVTRDPTNADTYRKKFRHYKALEKPFEMIVAIRQAVLKYGYLAKTNEWEEYYHGLTIYLTGALKFKDLSKMAKQVAFWGAATACKFKDEPPPQPWWIWQIGTRSVDIRIAILSFLATFLITGGVFIYNNPIPFSTPVAEGTEEGPTIESVTEPLTTTTVITPTNNNPPPPPSDEELEKMAMFTPTVTNTLTYTFYIDPYEVTNDDYRNCVEAGRCTIPEDTEFFENPNFGNHPVVAITWSQSLTYCEYLTKTLPLETEWDFAASTLDKSSGLTESIKTGSLNPVGKNPLDKTPEGVYDLWGNVHEWVYDTVEGSNRVIKGDYYGTSTPLTNEPPTDSDETLGFRCAYREPRQE